MIKSLLVSFIVLLSCTSWANHHIQGSKSAKNKQPKIAHFEIQMSIKAFDDKWIYGVQKNGNKIDLRRSAMGKIKVHKDIKTYKVSVKEMKYAKFKKD